MSRIFISYRRADSAAYAGRLYDHLSARFGADLVFMDIDTIQPGEDFVEVLENAVGSSLAVVVVIGGDWLTISNEHGERRLDDPNDFVRIEVATALQRNIRVIPVLVDGARMPKAEQLPDDLKLLHRRNALTVSNERFRTDVGRLIETLERILNPPPVSEPAQPEPPPAAAPKVEPPAQTVPDMWTQAAPTPQRRKPQPQSVAPPNYSSPAAGRQPAMQGSPTSTYAVAAERPLPAVWPPTLLVAIGWAIGFVLQAIGIGYEYNATYFVGAILNGVVIGLALRWFVPGFAWNYAVVVAIIWALETFLAFHRSVSSGLTFFLPFIAAVVTALVMWRAVPLMNWRPVAAIAAGWAVGIAASWFTPSLFGVQFTAPSLFAIPGALYGLVGSGIMFYMLRRASQHLRLSTDN